MCGKTKEPSGIQSCAPEVVHDIPLFLTHCYTDCTILADGI